MQQTASPPEQGLRPTGPVPPLLLWPAHERSVHMARHQLADTLAEWKLDHLADTAALVLSELMTNAVVHAKPFPPDRLVGSEIGVRILRLEDGVRIEVHDAATVRPVPRDASVDAEHGRGLLLVDALTGGRWGVSGREGIGKLVWAACVEKVEKKA